MIDGCLCELSQEPGPRRPRNRAIRSSRSARSLDTLVLSVSLFRCGFGATRQVLPLSSDYPLNVTRIGEDHRAGQPRRVQGVCKRLQLAGLIKPADRLRNRRSLVRIQSGALHREPAMRPGIQVHGLQDAFVVRRRNHRKRRTAWTCGKKPSRNYHAGGHQAAGSGRSDRKPSVRLGVERSLVQIQSPRFRLGTDPAGKPHSLLAATTPSLSGSARASLVSPTGGLLGPK